MTAGAGRQLVARRPQQRAVKLSLRIIGIEDSPLMLNRAQIRHLAVNHPVLKLLANRVRYALMCGRCRLLFQYLKQHRVWITSDGTNPHLSAAQDRQV